MREADANGDGALDATEWQTLVKGDRLFEVATLSYYDSNGDGKVTADEMANKPNRAFALLDKNGDCQIDRNETVQVINVDKPKPKEYDQHIPKTGGGDRWSGSVPDLRRSHRRVYDAGVIRTSAPFSSSVSRYTAPSGP